MTGEESTRELVSRADVRRAAERLCGTIHETPVDTSGTLASWADADAVHLKLETLQRTGSFKIRGATNRLAAADPEEIAGGVVAASGGNHAQGVALAAASQGVEATIVMPEVTPTAKIEATRGYGAEVVIHGEVYQDSYEHARQLADDRGAAFVHPFDDPAVIAGQGTVGLEMAAAVSDLDTVLVAIGGGGLISGIATAVPDDVRVIGVQTEGASHMAEAVARGEVYERAAIDTIAEGIAASRTEPYTLRHVRERVDRVVTVTDQAACAAMALLAERAKLVTESAGAVAPAALVADADGDVTPDAGRADGADRLVDVRGETVGIPVCGANVDLTTFADHTRRGLTALGRYGTVTVAVRDWPAALGRVGEAVERAGASVDDLRRLPASGRVQPTETAVAVSFEAGGPDHRERVTAALDDAENVRVTDVEIE